jgi:hypothetical protein
MHITQIDIRSGETWTPLGPWEEYQIDETAEDLLREVVHETAAGNRCPSGRGR